ncbi:hypothetical protein P6709_10150 [Jeotgalibacillus sp. ET6]|uniref:hypothetical protein n=1 Tax=Jeotgalibacillus sp. ET6 TaxID=3037260 RepID=UPI0024182385|nr:hypothetical protein [Jeotgalibacillus sp. ET6]MDG5472114.1 hypothetical protein [Jeotgalibacillus sp. ET6]
MTKKIVMIVFAGLVVFGLGLAAGVYLVEDEVTAEWSFAEVNADTTETTIASRFTNGDHLNEVTNLTSIFMQGEPVDAHPEIGDAQPDYVVSWNDPSRKVRVFTFYVWFSEEGGVYAIRPSDETDEPRYKGLNQMDAEFIKKMAIEGA